MTGPAAAAAGKEGKGGEEVEAKEGFRRVFSSRDSRTLPTRPLCHTRILLPPKFSLHDIQLSYLVNIPSPLFGVSLKIHPTLQVQASL